ncbi:hypothetical protein CSC94_07040 [Zhengella mangrovi]|uniref:histidine kinase n=1 Tax=Zhengella mangrovi TaxID=1982044 RepID=A0A2G1QQE7_9HYPH|nr:ATP-binding protein [Zhengella mangrovi]PHP67458.1 hypothetical protein CSC94_07040 [Zhengella mangrovi]
MMAGSRRIHAAVRALLLLFLVILVGSAAHAYVELQKIEDQSRYRIPENTIWAAAQGEIELNRTLTQLAEIANGSEVDSAMPLSLQFDLLWSRARLFQVGDLAATVRDDPDLAAIFDRYFKDLEAADRDVNAAGNGDGAAAGRMLGLLAPYRDSIRKLTMASLKSDRLERETLSRNHDLIEQQVSRFGTAAAILLVLMLAYLILGERRARLLLIDSTKVRENLEEIRLRAEKQAEQMRILARKATTASQAKSEFLAMMSHDIRTPLNAIIGLSEIMEREERDPEKSQRLATVLRASEGLLSLINDILDLTRLEVGKLRLEPREFSPADLLREIVDVTAVLASRNRNRISVRIDDHLPDTLIGDRDRIRQVLMNLVGNANKFTKNGDVLVRIDCAPQSNGNTRVRFSVSDNGQGISESLRKRLFQPFEQGENSRAVQGGSSGLGLAISQRLVRLMGGTIDLESAPGEGSEFSFQLELAVGDHGALKSGGTAVSGAFDLAGKTVLVVDDTSTSLLVAETMFRKFGADVETASCGEEAIEIGRDRAFDLVVLDVQMPGMDGPSTMKAMKAAGACGGAIYVALTAQSFPRDKARLMKAGFDAYISKPVRMRDIEAALVPFLGSIPVQAKRSADPAAVPEKDDLLDAEFLTVMTEDVGEATMRILLNQVEAEVEASINRLEEAAANGDRVQAVKAAHRMAGLLGQFAIERAANLARQIENAPDEALRTEQVQAAADMARRGLRALRMYLHCERLNETERVA